MLLQRVRYRYSLEIKKGRLRHRINSSWAAANVSLRADGRLSWSGPGGDGALDVRTCECEPARHEAKAAFVVAAREAGGTRGRAEILLGEILFRPSSR